MTTSWLTAADLLGGDSLLRGPDAETGGSLMGLPAPSQFGGSLFGIPNPSQLGGGNGSLLSLLPPPSSFASLEGLFAQEHSWTLGFPRAAGTADAPPADLGPSSFRGLAARLEARAQEPGPAPESAARVDEQQTAGSLRNETVQGQLDPQVESCSCMLWRTPQAS